MHAALREVTSRRNCRRNLYDIEFGSLRPHVNPRYPLNPIPRLTPPVLLALSNRALELLLVSQVTNSLIQRAEKQFVVTVTVAESPLSMALLDESARSLQLTGLVQ